MAPRLSIELAASCSKLIRVSPDTGEYRVPGVVSSTEEEIFLQVEHEATEKDFLHDKMPGPLLQTAHLPENYRPVAL